MRMFIAIVLITVGGSFGKNFSCLRRLNYECDTFGYFDVQDVKSESLLSFCQEVQDMFQCFIEGVSECGEDANSTDPLKYPLDYLKNVCKSDSDIYRVISNNFDCVSANIERRCYGNEELRKELGLMKSQSGSVFNQECQHFIFYTACESAMMADQCEEHVGPAVQEVLTNTLVSLNCPEDVTNIVTYVMESIELHNSSET